VDNGVSLRLRRQVTAISNDSSDGGTLSVEMDHWEPASYLNHKLDASTSSSSLLSSPPPASASSPPPTVSIMRRTAIIIAATVALSVIGISFVHVVSGIPFLSPHVSSVHAAACAFVVAFSFVAVLFDGPAAASHLHLKSSLAHAPSAPATVPSSPVIVNATAAKLAKAAPLSVGSGGECVSVADMAMGGSGFISAVGGRVVEKETVRTRWVMSHDS
jgi:hypothetical protein